MIEKISRIGFEKTISLIASGKAGVVLCCTLNELMMADKDKKVRVAMDRADVLTPDGMPLVWYLKWKYGKGERVYGPDIMVSLLAKKEKKFLFIGDLKNRDYFSKKGNYLVLPFKDNFTENDYQEIAKKINKLKINIVWVGLGARKQVLMADGLKRNGVNGSIITVGAAFDFLSGQMIQAPRWIRNLGLEWCFRLVCEPKRLWSRYTAIIYFVIGSLVRRLGFGVQR